MRAYTRLAFNASRLISPERCSCYTLAEALEHQSLSFLPYPLQSQLVGALREEAIRRGRVDLISLWSGQSRLLLRHRRAKELVEDLVAATERTLGRQTQSADR